MTSCIVCPLCCGGLLFVLLLALLHVLTDMAVEAFLDLDQAEDRAYTYPNATSASLVSSVWWPGCGYVHNMSDFSSGCAEPCFSAEWLDDMYAFNLRNPGELVNYTSRQADGVSTIKLGGWWLPAPASNATDPSPVVVLQHPFKSNSNHFRLQMAAFMLRRRGFGVLLSNWRDHGYSDSSGTGTYQWGDAYVYDVLGAWDFVVADPDGKLGGPRSSDLVGVMGFSKGAFVSTTAFGMEGRIPGAWADGGPFTPEAVFKHGARKTMASMSVGFLAPLTVGTVWDRLVEKASRRGVHLSRHLPENTLPAGPDTRRRIYVVADVGDDTVPLSQAQSLATLLQGHAEKYDATVWTTSASCHGSSHCMQLLDEYEDYETRLCAFWSGVFGLDSSTRCHSEGE